MLKEPEEEVEIRLIFGNKLFSFFSGGRPEASKRNLNFQGATWHQFFIVLQCMVIGQDIL
jgi:hypothetical protein